MIKSIYCNLIWNTSIYNFNLPLLFFFFLNFTLYFSLTLTEQSFEDLLFDFMCYYFCSEFGFNLYKSELMNFFNICQIHAFSYNLHFLIMVEFLWIIWKHWPDFRSILFNICWIPKKHHYNFLKTSIIDK